MANQLHIVIIDKQIEAAMIDLSMLHDGKIRKKWSNTKCTRFEWGLARPFHTSSQRKAI